MTGFGLRLTVAGLAATGGCGLAVDVVRSALVRRRLSARLGGGAAGRPEAVRAAARLVTGRAGDFRRRLGWLPRSTDVEHALVLEGIARALRGGGSLALAIEEVAAAPSPGSAATDLGVAAASARAGLPLAQALDRWGRSARPADDARVLAAAALTLGADLGGSSAQSLDAAAAGLRDRAALGREVQALTAQARASAAVMVIAPVGFVVVAGAADGRVSATLLTTPIGWACLGVGLALDAVGALWMAQMTRRAS